MEPTQRADKWGTVRASNRALIVATAMSYVGERDAELLGDIIAAHLANIIAAAERPVQPSADFPESAKQELVELTKAHSEEILKTVWHAMGDMFTRTLS